MCLLYFWYISRAEVLPPTVSTVFFTPETLYEAKHADCFWILPDEPGAGSARTVDREAGKQVLENMFWTGDHHESCDNVYQNIAASLLRCKILGSNCSTKCKMHLEISNTASML